MNDLKVLLCYNCKQVVANLSPSEVKKLEGIHFMCDGCGHLNMISSDRMFKGLNLDSSIGIYSVFDGCY